MSDDATIGASGLGKRRRSRRRFAGVAAVVVVALVVGLLVTKPWSEESGDRSDSTIWQAITTGFADDGRLTKDAALEAFAYVYGVDIPGVQIPDGADAQDRPTSGTGVARWVVGRWDELTADQQAVIDHTLARRTDDVVMDIDLASEPPRHGRSRPAVDDACARGASPIAVAVCDDVLADLARIGPRLGLRTISSESLCLANSVCERLAIPNVSIVLTDEDGGKVLALTQPVSNRFLTSPCNITVYHNAWSGVDPGSLGSSALHEILTHEVIHCYQNVIFGRPGAGSMPPWMTEGTALWLASDDTHIEEPIMQSVWRIGWLGRPTFPLFQRTYDAYGYYALLDAHNWDLWGLMAGAWRAAAASTGNPSESFIRALDGDNLEIREAWAPSIVREPTRGRVWETFGFGLPADARATSTFIRASSSPTSSEVMSRAATLTEVKASEGEVLTIETSGLAAVSDGVLNIPSFVSERFCTIEKCVCPKGTRLQGQNVAETHISIPFSLAFSAPAGGSTYTVVSHSLDAVCGRTDPLPPSDESTPGPCGDGCAASNGDPHMVSVDGTRYDFQAAGEFVLLRDSGTGIEVQARQEPLQGSKSVSVNTAVAVRVNDHRVSIYPAAAGLELHIDGEVADTDGAVDLGPGASVTRGTESIEIVLPDGTALWALARARYGIVLEIAPSDALRENGVGLLGPVLPGGAGLPALPDGTRIPRPVDSQERYKDLYEILSGGWRVDKETTLFDYASGGSTDDYTKAGFPDESAATGLAELTDEQLSAGFAACAAIDDALLWSQCLFDVAVTNDPGFADLYAAAESFITGGAAGGLDTNDSNPTATAPAPTGSTLDGPTAPLLAEVKGIRGAALADDGTLYMSVELPDDKFQLIAIDAATSTILERVDTDGGGPVALASGSVWVGTSNYAGQCAVVKFQPDTLDTEGKLDAPCWLTGLQIAPLDGAVWFLDPTGVDGDGKNTHLVRLDPATLAPGVSVELPTPNGFLRWSRSAIFYGDGIGGIFRLDPVARALEPIPGTPFDRVFPVGEGVWRQREQTAELFTGAAAPGETIDIDGSLVAVDDNALYADLPNDDGTQLWRYPTNGDDPAVVADAITIGTGAEERTLRFADNEPLLTVPGLIVKLWLVSPTTGGAAAALFLQAVPS